MPVVLVPEPYRGPTKGRGEFEVEGRSVRDCLAAVVDCSPGLGELIFDSQGAVLRFVKLFVNEEQLDSRALDTELEPDDRLEILAAIAGG